MKKNYAIICAALLTVFGTIPAFAADTDTEAPEPALQTTTCTWDTGHCCPPPYLNPETTEELTDTTTTVTEFDYCDTTTVTEQTDPDYLETYPMTTGPHFHMHDCAWFTTNQYDVTVDPGESGEVIMRYEPVQNVGHEPENVYVEIEDETVASFTYDGQQTVVVTGLCGGQTKLILRTHYDPETGYYEQERIIPITVTGGEGDADCDGSADVGDAVLVSRFIAEDPDAAITDHGQVLADMDGNAGLASGDVVCMLHKIALM